MECVKCSSTNVKVEAVSNVKSRGGTLPWWYWFGCVWVIDLMLYRMLIGFMGVNICHLFKKTKTKVQTYGVCQDCGKTWKL